jgi:hypothetical protein
MAEPVDATTYPRLAEYIGHLPAGLDSYPNCKSKAILVRTAIEGLDVSTLPEGLPNVVAELIQRPPAQGLWMPAVHSDAVFFAIADRFYPSRKAVYDWTRERTMSGVRSPTYRALTRVAGPWVLMKMASASHGLFQKGTYLRAASDGRKSLRLTMTHPPYLHFGLNHYSNVPMFQVLIEVAGGRDVEVRMPVSEPEQAVYLASWS